MAYETYTTEAIVCGRMPRGEHDYTLRLYTKDAGMIYARAGAARALESKLRYGLQDFSYSLVSLVHGRQEWRVTGATAIENFYYATPSRMHRAALRGALRSIKRFLPGAAAEPALFNMVLDGIRTLALEEYDPSAENIFLFRVLNRLGYISPEAPYAALAEAPSLTDAYTLYAALPRGKTAISEAVQKASTVSHL